MAFSEGIRSYVPMGAKIMSKSGCGCETSMQTSHRRRLILDHLGEAGFQLGRHCDLGAEGSPFA